MKMVAIIHQHLHIQIHCPNHLQYTKSVRFFLHNLTYKIVFSYLSFILVIGDKVEKRYSAGYQEVVVQNIETYIKNSNQGTIKSVVSPNIIQSDEPTEINVDVYNSTIFFLFVTAKITLIPNNMHFSNF